MKNYLPLFLLVLLSVQSFAYSSEQNISERFTSSLSELESELDTSDRSICEMAETLVEKARIAAFNLQALGRIYSDQDKKFKKIRKDFKQLEDTIGAFKMRKEVLEEALESEVSKKKIKHLTKDKDEAKNNLIKLLVDKSWIATKKSKSKTRIEKYEHFIAKYSWGSSEDDQNYVVNHLYKQLQNVQDTPFDLTRLEGDNNEGLHELRRELRWFLMETKALKGGVQFKKEENNCPIEQYEELVDMPIASSKYGVIPVEEGIVNPCYISQCLYLGVVEAVDKLGNVKDEVEAYLHLNTNVIFDTVPQSFRPRLTKIADKLSETNLLSVLDDQLNSCIN